MKTMLQKHNDLRVRRVFAWFPISGDYDEESYWLQRVWILESYEASAMTLSRLGHGYWRVINATITEVGIMRLYEARKEWLWHVELRRPPMGGSHVRRISNE